MNFDNTNSGALFKNDKGGNQRRPDYRGNLNVNGVEYDLSAWLKTSKKGDKYMSLSVQPKRTSDRRPDNRPADVDGYPKNSQQHPSSEFDDEIPF